MLDLKDLIEKNVANINKKYESESNKIRKKLAPFAGRPILEVPQEIRDEHAILVANINGEIKKENADYLKEFDELTEEKDEYVVEFKELAKKAITMYCEKEDLKIGDLGMTELSIESLVNVYSKLT